MELNLKPALTPFQIRPFSPKSTCRRGPRELQQPRARGMKELDLDHAKCIGCGTTRATVWLYAENGSGIRVWLHAGKSTTSRCRRNGSAAKKWMEANAGSSFQDWTATSKLIPLAPPEGASPREAPRSSKRLAARLSSPSSLAARFIDSEAVADDCEESDDDGSSVDDLLNDDDEESAGGAGMHAQLFAQLELGGVSAALSAFESGAVAGLPQKRARKQTEKWRNSPASKPRRKRAPARRACKLHPWSRMAESSSTGPQAWSRVPTICPRSRRQIFQLR